MSQNRENRRAADDLTATKSIILYTQPHCPACRRIEEFLTFHEVDYTKLDVSEDYDARDDLWEVHGSQNTPTLVIDGEAIIGFRREELERRLGLDKPTAP